MQTTSGNPVADRLKALSSLPTIEGTYLDTCIDRENKHMMEEALYSCALALMQVSHAIESPLVGTSARISLHAARHELLRCTRALEAVSAHTGAVPLSDAWHDRIVSAMESSWDKDAGKETDPLRPSLADRLHIWWEKRSERRAAERARAAETDDAFDTDDTWAFDWGGTR